MVVRTDCGKYGIYDVFWTLPPRIENRDVNQFLLLGISVNVNHSVGSELLIFVLKSQFLKIHVSIL